MNEFIVFYKSFYEAGQFLTDDERLKFYEAVIEYGFTGEAPELYGTAMGMFLAVKPAVDAGIKRRQTNEENGRKGGRPKKTGEPKQAPVEKEKPVTRLKKPEISEIEEYVKTKGYHVDAEQFFNFYESKGWKIGKAPMKNWHSAVATWEKRYLDEHPMQKQKAESKPTETKAEENPAEREELLRLLQKGNEHD